MELDEARRYLQWTEEKAGSLGSDDKDLFTRLTAEADRFDEAVARLADAGDTGGALRLATNLHIFWMEHGRLTTGRALLTAALDASSGEEPTPARIAAMNASARLAFRQGDNDVSRALLDESVASARSIGDREGEAWSLSLLSRVSLRDHDFTSVRERARASADIFQELGDKKSSWSPLHVIAYVTMMEGDLPAARAMFMDSIELARATGNDDLASGEYQNLGIIEARLGNLDAATDCFARCLDVVVATEDRYLLPYAYLGFANVAARRGQAERAALLLGATDAVLESTEMVLDPGDEPDYEQTVDLARAALGEDAFTAGCLRGRQMTFDEAVALARS